MEQIISLSLVPSRSWNWKTRAAAAEKKLAAFKAAIRADLEKF
jgi:hypothetical protein